VKSYLDNLSENLGNICNELADFLSTLEIKEFINDSDSGIVIMFPQFYYSSETNNEQKKIQFKLKTLFNEWIEHFLLLFKDAPDITNNEIKATIKYIKCKIELESDWGLSDDPKKNIKRIKEEFQKFQNLLCIHHSQPSHNLIIPDTNSLIICPEFSGYRDILNIETPTIILLPTVLSELDKLKVEHKNPDCREKAKSVIKRIKGLRNQGDLLSGVTFDKNICIKAIAKEPNFSRTLDWIDKENNDDRIIASILEIQRFYPSDITILVSADINLQNKATLAKIPFLEPPILE